MTAELTQLARLLRNTAAAALLPNWHGSAAARHKSDGSLVTASDRRPSAI
jgi:hypothetical protein